MRLVQKLRDRLTVLTRELAKFGIIGVFNTVLDFAVWNALVFIGPLKAQVVATVVSATSSYFMNRQWTFRHRARSGLRREYILFFGFNLIGLAITAGILAVAAYGFSVDDRLTLNIVKVFAIVVATVFRFWTYRRWVFLHPDDALLDEGPLGSQSAAHDGHQGRHADPAGDERAAAPGDTATPGRHAAPASAPAADAAPPGDDETRATAVGRQDL